MTQAIGDPEELERFALSLQQFIDSLNDAVAHLNGAFASLGDTWRDEKRMQFEEEYNSLVQQLHQFNASAAEQVPYLIALASRLRDYLQS
ncbi:WXG100 family type VII secretion target [Thermopirellula anaerolimosa]